MTAPTDADRTEPDAWLTLDGGPLRDALDAIEDARRGIEQAEAALDERRADFAAVLGAEVEALLAADPDDAVEAVRPTLAALYWDHPELRVSQLTAATGLSGANLRRIVGPRVLDADCGNCDRPFRVVRTSRSSHVHDTCWDCRQLALYGPTWQDEPGWGPARAGLQRQTPTGPTPPPPGRDDDPIERLVAHLLAVLDECDGTLQQTHAWAAAEGIDPGVVADYVRDRGGHCDCEVIANVWS